MKSVLGVTLGHDTSFAHILDGKVVGIMEAERYFRQKRYKLHCLTLEPGKHISGYQYVSLEDMELFLGLVASEWGAKFDALAVQNAGRVEEFNNFQGILKKQGFQFGAAYHVDHHLSHAALSYYTSPFDDALILSYDGEGNDGQTIFFKGKGNNLTYLQNNPLRFGQSYNNLGYIVGIRPEICGTSAGKTMGLTAYGERVDEWMPFAREYVKKYVKAPPKTVDGLRSYGKAHRINDVALRDIPDLKKFLVPAEDKEGGVKGIVQSLTGRKQTVLRLAGPEDKTAQNLASTVQSAWTEEVIDLIKPYIGEYKNLCIVGGCALNGITNYEIQQLGAFASTYFVPNPSDCGLSAGAALYAYWNFGDNGVFTGYGEYFSPYLGSEVFDKNDLPSLRNKYPNLELDSSQTASLLAGLVYSDYMVGVIRDRYEIGPRALGNRSILCNPLNKDMKDIVNKKVKHREWYRPFAPIAAAERAADYFTNVADIPYMSVICYTKPEYREVLPSITHVDGSSRLQTLRKEDHPFMHETLMEFEKLSGMPIMLNTSFNPGGEPILNYYSVGLEMLDTTELDFVLIEDSLFCKPGRESLLTSLKN
jgi:carbamoyltransferase